jgi:mRNA interferase HigB
MELVNVIAIHRFVRKHRDASGWCHWMLTVTQANWQSIADVRTDYPSADGVPLKSRVVVTVFNVKGNEYRLLTVIDYSIRRLRVIDILTPNIAGDDGKDDDAFDDKKSSRSFGPLSCLGSQISPAPHSYRGRCY